SVHAAATLALAATAGLAIVVLPSCLRAAARLPLDRIKLPAGFTIAVYADNIPDARSMALAPDGTVVVGNREKDKVYAVANKQVVTIASGLRTPNGVAFRDGSLYVAEVNRVLRFDKAIEWLAQPAAGRSALKPSVVSDKFPSDSHHGWKYLAFGADGMLYLQVGAPCNICDRGDPYATIWRMKPDGSAL